MAFNPADVVSSILHAQLNKRRLINKPAEFTWSPSVYVFRDAKTGLITVSRDLSTFKITGKTYYVSTEGNNDNDGLTEATAFRSVQYAVTRPDVDAIMVKAGIYSRGVGTFPTSPTRNISIIGYGGEVVLSAHDGLVWSLNSGATYRANRSTVQEVYDFRYKNEYGDAQRLTKAASIAEVDATPGSWYSDGTVLYVQTSDSRSPDSNIRPYLSVKNGYVEGGVTVYMEGITFEGGNYAFQAVNTASGVPVVYAKNCKFKYSGLTNAFSALGSETYLQDCEAAQAMNDGFNYHEYNGVKCKGVEINCVGRHNGYGGGDNNNGSTAHEASKIIRIGGKYFNNNGPNVVDVNGSQSWNVGVSAFKSTGAGTQNVNFYIDGDMWLDSCVSLESSTDLRVNPGAMRVRNMVTMGRNMVATGSSLMDY